MLMEVKDNKVMVSVWCRTYNHVNYIRDALEGFISQQTNFAYKVIIFDDASTDGTSDIVREYEAKYPELLHAIIAEKNTYHRPDSLELTLEIWHKYLTGKYVAFCEGDDFWIDNNKLQIQVDYMETHPECSMYLHNSLWLNCQNGILKAGDPYKGNGEWNVSAKEIILQQRRFPPTASFFFRGEQLTKPSFFCNVPASDYTTLLYALISGNIHYNSRIMSVYRVFSNGSFGTRLYQNMSFRLNYYFKMYIFSDKFDKYTDYKYHEWCLKRIAAYTFPIRWGCDIEIPIVEYLGYSKEYKNTIPSEYFEYINKLEKWRRQNLEADFYTFHDKYDHIIIMGTGEFGTCMARQFTHHHITFDGFVVTSRREDENSLMGKPVWDFLELPYDKVSIGVVIAICPYAGNYGWDSVLNSLAIAEIENYYSPFL